jgi:hypothetical protein
MQAKHNAIALTAGSQVHAAALAWSGAHRWQQRDIRKARPTQGRGKHVAFVRDVGCVIQVLQRAAAAGAEVGAVQPVQPNADNPV